MDNKLSRLQERKIAKLAAITTCVGYLQKIAEIQQEKVLSEKEVAELVSRVDDKMPDEVIETMDSELLKSEITRNIAEAAQELEDIATGKNSVPSVTPADLHVNALGSGSIVNTVASNPHANTGGVQLVQDVPVIETNLLTTNNQSKGGDVKMANLQKVADSREIMALKYELGNNTIKFATLANAILKLAEAVSVATAGATDALQNAATTTAMQNLETGSKPAEVTAPVADAKINGLTADPSKMTDQAADQAKAGTLPGTEVKPNEYKNAATKPLSLQELIRKHKK